MNRVLRRPMFRTGGSAEGITSGLSRQGYKGTDNPSDQRVLQDVLPGMTIGQMRNLSKELSYRPQRNNLRDFMIGFGLDIASRPPSGSIFSTAAAAAKDPFDRYTASKQEADAAQYATESDMFKTMLGAQADILAAQAKGKGGKEWLKQWEFQQVPVLIDKIAEIEAIPVEERTTEQQNELDSAKINLGRLEKEDPFIGWFLKSDESGKLFKNIKNKLYNDGLQQDPPTYESEEDPKLREDTYKEFQRQVKEMGKADGGRVGYQMGGDVMPGQPMQAAMPTDQGAAPEDTAGVTYEELRARLPQEVTDDIVRLLANSAEALEDFAMIQTEQDINIFNKKYGVNLVLPSEG
jgi:hypothetical protein